MCTDVYILIHIYMLIAQKAIAAFNSYDGLKLGSRWACGGLIIFLPAGRGGCDSR